jgi:hypothetical protein
MRANFLLIAFLGAMALAAPTPLDGEYIPSEDTPQSD